VTSPPINISCDCGETRLVPFGEAWTCERCGRRWDTSQIPEDEYLARLRRMRLFRAEPLGLLALAVLVFVPLVFFVSARFILLAGIAGFGFMVVYMPFWRRRVRRAVASAPTWELHPE
jgi:hypothetical protein